MVFHLLYITILPLPFSSFWLISIDYRHLAYRLSRCVGYIFFPISTSTMSCYQVALLFMISWWLHLFLLLKTSSSRVSMFPGLHFTLHRLLALCCFSFFFVLYHVSLGWPSWFPSNIIFPFHFLDYIHGRFFSHLTLAMVIFPTRPHGCSQFSSKSSSLDILFMFLYVFVGSSSICSICSGRLVIILYS